MLHLLIFMLSGAAMAGTITGDWVKGRKQDFRYVTEYEVKKTERAFRGVPWIQEDCHDDGDRFANWSRTISYEIKYNGGVSFELLGIGIELGAERTQSVDVAFERWVHATRGIRAKHVLHESFEDWEGTTRVEFLQENGEIISGKKSYPFRLSHMNYGLFVKREILEVCSE